jgi:hypothetical protein
MNIRFVGQPFEDGSNLYEVLTEGVEAGDIASLSAAVAWAKRSGLRRLEAALREIRDGGGRTQLVVGIDERGATEEGLRMAMELFDEVYVLNDPSGRTFHTKMFILKGDDRARLFVGSNNATAGGVFYNYEAGLVVELHLTEAEDRALLEEAEGYIARLIADEEICKPLTIEVLGELLADPRYGVGREGRRQREGAADEGPEDTDAGVDTRPLTLFGTSQEPKKAPPPAPAPAGPLPPPPLGPAPPVPIPARPPAAMAAPERRWSKQLPASDAQRPPLPGTNPTGNVRLTQAHHPIDWITFFRDDLFGEAGWVQEPGTDKEVATVEFHVTVDGYDQGIHRLLISYVPHREAGQANHTTVLHWGEMIPMLDANDFTDYYLTLERLTDGIYHLDLSLVEPAPPYVGP